MSLHSSPIDNLNVEQKSQTLAILLRCADNHYQGGMPDELENKWTAFTGGHSNDSNDANLTYDFLLTGVYSFSQLIDLRLGSTLYEVNQGVASFNIILEESNDLNNWEPYGVYSLELSDDGNANTKFFRFKMAN